ncbi:sulfotransferase family protein [Pseudomonas sp. 6D_7.1_Bac1]|uniref:sulfotransferase family protein n=1 Tax=Pseudomonas sp. 6D_7.1_Bac1 TaxID=2971615 RepID=UPI0021C998F0|nr:sulfotransferase [Pseudomonas sp. 6D_7.1_Bac1]MCU1750202.1 sulfotransferase [Pseudomonas sp. 6D_7.1_Bac1]
MNITNKQVSDGNARPRPILMIPLRRCGSHALRLRLNLNPQFHSPYPVHIADFMPVVPLYGDLADDNAYFRMVVDVVGLQAASIVKWPGASFDPIDIFERVRYEEPRSVHRIVWELLLRSAEQHQAQVVMDKSLDNVHYAHELMQTFPHMLLLNVVRDPRAQVASMNRAIIHDFDTLINTQTWVAAHRAAQSLIERYPERVLTIRYEDFLLDQEATLKRICHFFGIHFLDKMLEISESQEARQISQISALWSSNCFPPIAANIDKFKVQLKTHEIEIIETLAKEFMLRYGYELMTDADFAFDSHMLVTATERSNDAKGLAWRELEQRNFQDYILRQYRADYLASVRGRLERRIITSAPSLQGRS